MAERKMSERKRAAMEKGRANAAAKAAARPQRKADDDGGAAAGGHAAANAVHTIQSML